MAPKRITRITIVAKKRNRWLSFMSKYKRRNWFPKTTHFFFLISLSIEKLSFDTFQTNVIVYFRHTPIKNLTSNLIHQGTKYRFSNTCIVTWGNLTEGPIFNTEGLFIQVFRSHGINPWIAALHFSSLRSEKGTWEFPFSFNERFSKFPARGLFCPHEKTIKETTLLWSSLGHYGGFPLSVPFVTLHYTVRRK